MICMNKYAIEIFYSDEDEGYIAVAPELPDCSAFGRTEIEALQEIKTAIALWIKTAKNEGKEIPLPIGKPFLSKAKELWPERMDKARSPGRPLLLY